MLPSIMKPMLPILVGWCGLMFSCGLAGERLADSSPTVIGEERGWDREGGDLRGVNVLNMGGSI